MKRFLKWFFDKLPKREVTPELRKRIKIEFPGFHLAKNGPGRRKKVVSKYDEVANESSL